MNSAEIRTVRQMAAGLAHRYAHGEQVSAIAAEVMRISPPKCAVYVALRVASYMPDNDELSFRRHLLRQLLAV